MFLNKQAGHKHLIANIKWNSHPISEISKVVWARAYKPVLFILPSGGVVGLSASDGLARG
jgi:hypothetical protein